MGSAPRAVSCPLNSQPRRLCLSVVQARSQCDWEPTTPGSLALSTLRRPSLPRSYATTAVSGSTSLYSASLLHMRTALWVALSNPDDWHGFHLDSYTKPPEHYYTV